MKSSPSSNKDFLIAPPTRVKASGGFSKVGTWLSYKYSVHKKLIVALMITAISSAVLYGGIVKVSDVYQANKLQKIEAQKIAEAKAIKERIEMLKKAFETQKILTPMEDKDFAEVLDYANASYLASIRDLSSGYFAMQYVAEEGEYEVVFDSMQREFTDIVNEMNVEYAELIKLMNGFKNNVRIYDAALKNENVEIINALEKTMKSDMNLYAKWYNWKVSGEMRKTDRVKERANRHIETIKSLDGLNKYLASKQSEINKLEPFSSLVIKR